MSMNIYSKGRFIPTPALNAGEVVFDRDGFIRTVEAVITPSAWLTTDGFVMVGGAFEALDVTDHPVVRCNIVNELKARGAL